MTKYDCNNNKITKILTSFKKFLQLDFEVKITWNPDCSVFILYPFKCNETQSMLWTDMNVFQTDTDTFTDDLPLEIHRFFLMKLKKQLSYQMPRVISATCFLLNVVALQGGPNVKPLFAVCFGFAGFSLLWKSKIYFIVVKIKKS